MRCPRCDRNQKFSQGMTCGCGYGFVLNPKEPPYLADRGFESAIQSASQERSAPYTPEQLHATVFRRRNRWWWRRRLVAVRGTHHVDATRKVLRRWQASRREVGPLLTEPGLAAAAAFGWPEADVYDYGAEGVVVVSRPMLVDLLVANRLHATAKVVVIDPVNDYPARVVERAATLLADRPDLPVFLLHDAEVAAAEELEAAARRRLGMQGNPIVDIGLGEEAHRLHRSMHWTRSCRPVLVDYLHPKLLTDGIAAAIAERCSLADLLTREKGSSGDGFLLFADGDGDFG